MRRRLGMVVALGLLVMPAFAFGSPNAMERALLHRINAVRAAHRLRPLRARSALHAIAVAHTAYLVRIEQLRHESADGTSAVARIRHAIRTSAAGETLAAAGSVAEIVRLWMHSPPHRAILLDARLHYIGVGMRVGVFGGWRMRYATADLAR